MGWTMEVLPLVPCALGVQEVDLVHGDELLGDGAREVTATLIVAHDQGHLGAPEPGESFAWPEGYREIRIVVVDDILDRLSSPQILLAEAREVAGQRQDFADEYLRYVGRRHGTVGEDGDQEKTRYRGY